MRKVSLALILVTLISGVPRAQSQRDAAGADSSDARVRAWRADLRHFAAELPKRHKNLFFRITRQEFEREVARLYEAIPSMQDFEVRVAFLRLAAMAGDSHTGVSWRREDFHLYPLRLYSFREGLHVTAAPEEYRQALGARLVRVGNADAETAAAGLRRLIPCENDSCFRNYLPDFLNVSEFLYALRIQPDARRGSFVFEDAAGKQFTLEMDALPFQKWQSLRWAFVPVPRGEREQMLWTLNQNINYWYEYLPGSKTLYFAYNRCRETKSRPFGEFGKELLAFADSHAVERFVIDMRRNSGGSEALLLPFIAELRRRAAVNRAGRLFVVVGRGTFSSAAQNAATLRQTTRAVVVGEPTGQKPNHYGEVRTFTLPNSGLEVTYSTVFWKRADGDPPAFMPDVLAEPSFADFSAGRDSALTAILSYKQSDAR